VGCPAKPAQIHSESAGFPAIRRTARCLRAAPGTLLLPWPGGPAALAASRQGPFGVTFLAGSRAGVRRERKADMVPHLTYPEAIVVGLFQGVTELFPVSSLGHAVLIPALVGGGWAQDLNVSAPQSPYLAFVVGLHVATAIAMIIYFWRDWLRIVGGFFTSIAHRRIETVDQKLAWMIIFATIPVGIAGALLQHTVQDTFAKPVLTASFLAVNGLILFAGERVRRQQAAAPGGGRPRPAPPRPLVEETWVAGSNPARSRGDATLPGRPPGPAGSYRGDWDAAPAGNAPRTQIAGRHSAGQRAVRQQEVNEAIEADARLTEVGYLRGTLLGSLQIFALLPGISRDGVVMVGGMFRGLSRQDAARFSFLLSAPVILAAGALKLGELTGPDGAGIRGQVLAGSIVSGVSAFLALRFLVRYFQDHNRTLTPFAIYCLVVGIGSAIYLSVR
jgi:undecaprenyl-diphosphatase